jgi:glycosyltransferase involved in cell wall biosynthesis
MENLTLVIPAKKEKESLPSVLDELKKYQIKTLIVLEKSDVETIESLKNYDCEILYQANKGYGDALIQGINHVKTKYFSIFNADGSFNPVELKTMLTKLETDNLDIIFGSRYEKDCSSEDDNLTTFVGNFIFTKLGNIFFKLKLTDILYTFVLGKTLKVQNLKLEQKNFVFCVELPIKSSRAKLKISTSKSHERARFGGKKKVNAMRDGFFILIGMIKFFFKQNS